MTLFVRHNFVMHSGEPSAWKIECDALTDEDLATLALMASERLAWGDVYGVPRGGLRFAEALRQYSRDGNWPRLIVDDVLTTGQSMIEARAGMDGPLGLVIFARGKCPPWVTPMFQLWGKARRE